MRVGVRQIQERLSPLRRELSRQLRLRLARVLARRRPAPERPIWIFGGAVGAAYGDNSAALHRHVVAQLPQVQAYWVINRDSPDVELARSVGPVLFSDEIETYVLALQAQVHVISHGLHDVPTCASRHSRALKVRLGHGLTALKKTKPPPLRSLESANRVFGLVPVSSDFERANKRTWSIPDERIVVTGLPRFDELVRRSLEVDTKERTVLYMPTWREWLPRSAEEVKRSEFLTRVQGFLGSTRLQEVLEKHDLVLEVYLHRLLRDEVAQLIEARGRVRLLPTRVDVQAHLAKARALITDYSSVTWDMLYLGRPVLFYSFDVDTYERYRGGYLDLGKDLPGPAAANEEDLIGLLDEAAGSEWALSPAAVEWSERVFPWKDRGNCARVVAAILERIG